MESISLIINDKLVMFNDSKSIIYQLKYDDEFLRAYVLQKFLNKTEEIEAAGLLNVNFSTLEINRIDSDIGFIESVEEEDLNRITTELQCDTDSLKDNKTWSHEATLLLLSLIKRYDKDLENKVKKRVWQKIATEMSKHGYKYTTTQVESKWKTLIRMYKDIKRNNEESGKSRKNWKYWDTVHEIVFNKAEIIAPATCSSSKGLVINTQDDQANNNMACSSHESTPTSSFIKKRKVQENSVERRHKEKMEKLDKLQKSVDVLIDWLQEKNNNNTQ